ncbi:MAG: iron-sulfur cluster assembly accessory protein [Planctomycetia bacterium]|nr:iron-sulfur cluster assembly accessory protein [Planctomycetia bacterium]
MAMSLTSRASAEVKKIMASQELSSETFVRALIVGGGCSGMQYSLGFDTEFDPVNDVRYMSDGVGVVTEKKFALFLDGAKIDFIDSDSAKGFSIDNPKFPAGSGCAGCGH